MPNLIDTFYAQVLLATELLITSTVVSFARTKSSCSTADVFLPGGPWSRGHAMERCLEKYVVTLQDTARRSVSSQQEWSQRLKVVIASLGRVLAVQPFLFLHCVPSFCHDNAAFQERCDLETRLISAVAKLCDLPEQHEELFDMLSGGDSAVSSPRHRPGLSNGDGNISGRQEDEEEEEEARLPYAEVSDAMWSRQVPPGIREMQAIAAAVDANNWQDVLATILCKTTIALGRMSDHVTTGKPLSDMLRVWRSSLRNRRDSAAGSLSWKRALLNSYSRLSSVMLPAAVTSGGRRTAERAPSPSPLLLGISRSVNLFQEIMEPLLASPSTYWEVFPTSFFQGIGHCDNGATHSKVYLVKLGGNILSNIVGEWCVFMCVLITKK
jgi:hypothetical protein